jgi:hypothetical protein
MCMYAAFLFLFLRQVWVFDPYQANPASACPGTSLLTVLQVILLLLHSFDDDDAAAAADDVTNVTDDVTDAVVIQ